MNEVSTKTRAATLSAEKAQCNNLLSALGHTRHIKTDGMSLLLLQIMYLLIYNVCVVFLRLRKLVKIDYLGINDIIYE